MKIRLSKPLLVGGAVAVGAAGAIAFDYPHFDFGQKVQEQLQNLSWQLFGIGKPLTETAPAVPQPYRTAAQAASDQIELAKSLKAEYLTREAGNALDMMVLFPDAEKPTHIIGCVEGGRQAIGTWPDGTTKFNPSVQRIDIKTGAVETILRGMIACDPVKLTPWGTIIAGEETDDGGLYEIIDPLGTTNHTITNRAAGTVAAPGGAASANVAKRPALPVLAYEGIAILPSGITYLGDEERPGTTRKDADGGAVYKFVPAVPHPGGNIADLSQSPYVAGSNFAMQVSCVGNNQQVGQGCEIGAGAWIAIRGAFARNDADSLGATGYYRPEDMALDPYYADEAHPAAVRFCWANTGNEGAQNYGEVMCAVDTLPTVSSATRRTVITNRFIEGGGRFTQVDNLEFQPGTRNLFLIEDNANGDILSCLPDGADEDIKSDGCIFVASVKDQSAEPTGLVFSADGRTAWLSIQHSNDALMPKVDDYATDDLIKITAK